MQNPFETIHIEIVELKNLVTKLLNKPNEELATKLYTINEAAKVLKVSRQTVRNQIDRGNIKAYRTGDGIRIYHSELYNSLNEVKSIKYKR